MTPEEAAGRRVLDGTATPEDIELWLGWEIRASGGKVIEKIAGGLLERAKAAEKGDPVS